MAHGGIGFAGQERLVDLDLTVDELAVEHDLVATVDDHEVVLDEPVAGVAPGQACVFYDGTQVLGGGWIAKARPPILRADIASGGVAQLVRAEES